MNTFEDGKVSNQFSDGPPLGKLAPSGGSAVREATSVGAFPLHQQGPRDWLRQTAGAAAPSGGRELHAVNDRGGYIFHFAISCAGDKAS